jgi:hypothetical protein
MEFDIIRYLRGRIWGDFVFDSNEDSGSHVPRNDSL